MATRLRLLAGKGIPFLKPYWAGEEWRLVAQSLAGRSFREQVPLLETALAELLGVPTVAALVSGRVAIRVALESFDLPAQSEIVMPSYCCAAVADAVIAAGHRPVFVDIDETFALSVDGVESVYGHDVRAMMIPHLFGRWARTTPDLLEWARIREVAVVDDACPVFGLKADARWVGTAGDAGCFSMGIGKTLMGPAGGFLVSTRKDLAEKTRRRVVKREPIFIARRRLGGFVARYGLASTSLVARTTWGFINKRLATGDRPVAARSREISQEHPEGSEIEARDRELLRLYRCSGIDAALGLAQLNRCAEILEARRKNAGSLLEAVRGTDPARVLLPEHVPTHGFTKFVVAFLGKESPGTASRVRQHMWRAAIETESTYTPLHLRAGYRDYRRGSMDFTERIWRGAFAVPVRPNLRLAELGRIQTTLRESLRRLDAL